MSVSVLPSRNPEISSFGRIFHLYRRYKYRKDFRLLKELITFYNNDQSFQGHRDPWLLLRSILHRNEYQYLYSSRSFTFPYIRFRFYGPYPLWPPIIIYRIYTTHVPTIDVGYFSPRPSYIDSSAIRTNKPETKENKIVTSVGYCTTDDEKSCLPPYTKNNASEVQPLVQLKVGKRSIPVVLRGKEDTNTANMVSTMVTLYRTNPCRTNPWRSLTCSILESSRTPENYAYYGAGLPTTNYVSSTSLPSSIHPAFGLQYCFLHNQCIHQCSIIRNNRKSLPKNISLSPPPRVKPSRKTLSSSMSFSMKQRLSIQSPNQQQRRIRRYQRSLSSVLINSLPSSSTVPSSIVMEEEEEETVVVQPFRSFSSFSTPSVVDEQRTIKKYDNNDDNNTDEQLYPFIYGTMATKQHPFLMVYDDLLNEEEDDDDDSNDEGTEMDRFDTFCKRKSTPPSSHATVTRFFMVQDGNGNSDTEEQQEKETNNLLRWIDTLDYQHYTDTWLRNGTLLPYEGSHLPRK